MLLIEPPPHIPQGEVLEYLLRVAISGDRIFAIGVLRWIGIIKKQGLPVPIEPEVREFILLVVALIELLHHIDRLVIVGPENELRSAVPFLAHLHHRREEYLPLVPVANSVRDIHHKHIHSGILKHRDVFADHPLVLTQEIAHLRLSPMVHVVFPKRVVLIVTGCRVLRENLGHIGVGSRKIMVTFRMPSDVEHAHNTSLVGFHFTDRVNQRHLPSKSVSGHPCVAHEVRRIVDRSPSTGSQEKDRD